ncbi:MAG: hypothetical protein WC365_04265 [Candidatus Babeliales bacterium]|jgi:hypothetical protein
MTKDICIRKVKILQGKAKDAADKQNLTPNDLVIVTTTINKDSPPSYNVEKVIGDPVSYLLNRH